MAISKDFLNILVCPRTQQKLRELELSKVEELNKSIESKTLRNQKGSVIEEKIGGALVREDGKVAYLIRDDIPVMLIDEAIVLT